MTCKHLDKLNSLNIINWDQNIILLHFILMNSLTNMHKCGHNIWPPLDKCITVMDSMDKIFITCGLLHQEITKMVLLLNHGMMKFNFMISQNLILVLKQDILHKWFGKDLKELDLDLHQVLMEKISLLQNMTLQETSWDNLLKMYFLLDLILTFSNQIILQFLGLKKSIKFNRKYPLIKWKTYILLIWVKIILFLLIINFFILTRNRIIKICKNFVSFILWKVSKANQFFVKQPLLTKPKSHSLFKKSLLIHPKKDKSELRSFLMLCVIPIFTL